MLLPTLILIVLVAILVFVFRVELVTKQTNVKTVDFFKSVHLMLNRDIIHKRLTQFVQTNKIHGFLCYWWGYKRAFIAVDPDAAQWVLTQKEDMISKTVPPTSPAMRDIMSKTVVLVSGETWRRQRQAYNPVFNTTAYRELFPAFAQNVNKCISTIPLNKDIDIVPVMSAFTIDLLGQVVFDYDFGQMENKDDEYYPSYKRIFSFGSPSAIAFAIFPWLQLLPIPWAKQMVSDLAKLRELMQKVLKNHKSKDKYDILAILMENSHPDAQNYLSPEEIFANMLILFVAGHETTAAALSWLFYELAANPDVQDKMYQEIRTVIGDKQPTFESVNNLTYVNNVIQENMRCHPSAPMSNSRIALKDLFYDNNFIPKGSLVGTSAFIIHHNPNYWENPFKFDPDRFSPDNIKGRHKFAYLPFSLGPRMCLGNNFSLIEQRLFLARFITEYEIVKPSDHVLQAEYGKRTIGGPGDMWIQIKQRNK